MKENEEELTGLNRNEFITALQLISLAQASLPYNTHYLQTQREIPLSLPSIWVDSSFINFYSKIPFLDPSFTSDAGSSTIPNKNYYNYPEDIKIDKNSNESKILILQTALNDCLVKENYDKGNALPKI